MSNDTQMTERLEVSLGELIVSVLIAAIAAVILIAYAVDLAGWPIDPWPVGVLVVATLGLGMLATWRWGPRVRLQARWGELGCLALILVGLPLYIYFLSGNTWLPVSGNVDAVHHLLLINFIQERASVPHDPALWHYLGAFAYYSPGSHILAALTGRVLGMTGLYLIEPIMAVIAALRTAVFFLIAMRLLPVRRERPLLALAGVILLLAAYGYVLNSFLYFFYYAQVVSELFALAMLWALVVWNDRPWFGPLAFFSLCGIAVWLSWPVWLTMPVLALAGLLVLRRDLDWRRRILTYALALLPIAAVVVVYTVGRASEVSILQAEGGVTRAAVGVFGWPMLALAVVGVAASARRRVMQPVWLFAAVLGLQIVAFAVLDTIHQVQSYYQMHKMFYLLVYPIGLYATLGLAGLWEMAARRWARVGEGLAVALPLVALALAVWNGVPTEPLPRNEYTTFNDPLYATESWARQNLPAGCVDYLVDYVITAYWLHLDLGNPMADARTESIIGHYQERLTSPNRWTRPRGFPYAIVEDMESVPEDVRSHFKVLYQDGPAAVVYRTGECDDDTVPLQRYSPPPRTRTLAALFDQALGTRLAVY